jgi:3-hydroxyacyl-CoA dehydrogenase
MLFMFAGDQEFDEINLMIAQFQNTMTRARFSSVPVVVAPHNMALGGGCELSLHADHIPVADDLVAARMRAAVASTSARN